MGFSSKECFRLLLGDARQEHIFSGEDWFLDDVRINGFFF